MIQVYSKGVQVDNISGENIFSSDKEVSVTLNGISPADFVNEFMVEEILEALDFSQVFDWAVAQHDEEEDD